MKAIYAAVSAAAWCSALGTLLASALLGWGWPAIAGGAVAVLLLGLIILDELAGWNRKRRVLRRHDDRWIDRLARRDSQMFGRWS